MNNAMVGAEFKTSENYPTTMVALFIACFYSAGIPILIIFAMITMLTMYLVEKYLILNEYSKGYYLDEKTNYSMNFLYSDYGINQMGDYFSHRSIILDL